MSAEVSIKDEEFLRTFLNYAKSGNEEELVKLQTLLDEGATTAAFVDYELGPGNFASVVKDFLSENNGVRNHKNFIKALETVVKAGNAFLTNKGYVGNGGAPAAYFIMNFLGGEYNRNLKNVAQENRQIEKIKEAYELLLMMTKHGLRIRNYFWADFIGNLFLDKPSVHPEIVKVQYNVIELAGENGAFEFDKEFNAEEEIPFIFNRLKNLFSPEREDILYKLTEAANKNAGLAEWLLNQNISRTLNEQMLNIFLSSKNHRKLLITLIERSVLLKEWIFKSSVLFILIDKKEKVIIQKLLQLNKGKMKKARDKQGNTLLHHLCTVRGKTEGIVSLLLKQDFDKNEPNHKGETPLAIAERMRNTNLINILS